MNDSNENFESVERRLRAERSELTAIELDRIKRNAMARTSDQGGRGMAPKSRLVAVLLSVGVIASGGGAVLAASGGSSSQGSSANSQYCPPSSPAAGKPKHDGGNGAKCGHPNDGNGNNGKGNGKGK